MKHFKYLTGVATILLLCGCSSPPPPPPVEWDTQSNEINTTVPNWQENNVVVSTPTPTGNWSYIATNFQGDDTSYPIAFYYSVAHSKKIVISTQSPSEYFKAKDWLKSHGAKGVFIFQSKQRCLACSTTDIYLSR